MFFLSKACETSSFLKVLFFIKELIKYISIIVPIGLIVLLSIDFMKNVIGKEDEMSKNLKMAIRRLIYTVIIFLIPTITNISVSILNGAGISVNYNECLSNANLSTIKYFELEEDISEEEYIPDAPVDPGKSGSIISSDSKGTGNNSSNDIEDYSDISSTGSQKILDIAESKYKKIEADGHWVHSFKCGNNKCTTCCKFVSDVLKAADYQKSGYICHMGHTSKPTGLDKLHKDKVSISYNQSINKLEPGDVIVYSKPNSDDGNVAIFAKKKGGKYYFYGASDNKEIQRDNHPNSLMSNYWIGKSGKITIIRAK